MQTQIYVNGNDARGVQPSRRMSLIIHESLIIIPHSLDCDAFFSAATGGVNIPEKDQSSNWL